ncbi:Canalicular multispecific organic anion transporter 1 [Sorochytrium milnesiophthora]
MQHMMGREDLDVTPCYAKSLLQLLPSVCVLLLGVFGLVYVWHRPLCFKVDRRLQLKLGPYMYFWASSREIKRLNSGAKAPIYQHFGESITGIVITRAYGYQAQNIGRLESQINIRATYAKYSASRWLGVSVNAIGSLIILCVAVSGVIMRNGQPDFLTMMLSRGLCYLEANFVAVERIKAYSNIPSEAAKDDVVVQPSWPLSANITFDEYTTAYQLLIDDTSIQPVLRNLNLKIRGGEKIGMCGRSGAGRSTITQLLFHIIEAVTGSIEIDGQDISIVGLTDLRSRSTIIPQDSMLFQCAVRSNLDPLSKHSDAAVWKALVLVNFPEYVAAQEGKLRAEEKTGGSNFSAGQTQLLTLAAVLLRKQRTVIFDEATSATDAETDAIVQHTIRSEFKDCTVLILAHRIATIMDSDPILMLDQGQVAEFDILQVLPQNLDSAFAKLGGRTKAQ